MLECFPRQGTTLPNPCRTERQIKMTITAESKQSRS